MFIELYLKIFTLAKKEKEKARNGRRKLDDVPLMQQETLESRKEKLRNFASKQVCKWKGKGGKKRIRIA
jgi:hypothetical protein